MIRIARQSKKLIIPETSFLLAGGPILPPTANPWFHVNTFFINRVISFRNSLHIKKHIALMPVGISVFYFQRSIIDFIFPKSFSGLFRFPEVQFDKFFTSFLCILSDFSFLGEQTIFLKSRKTAFLRPAGRKKAVGPHFMVCSACLWSRSTNVCSSVRRLPLSG